MDGSVGTQVGSILLTLNVAFGVAALPVWPYNKHWDYWPAAGFSVVIALTLALTLGGKL